MANRYYVSFTPTPGTVVLQGAEARHLATVLRAKPGDRVVLFAGDGFEYPAEVESVGKRDVTLSVRDGQRPNRELPFQLEVAVAMPKGDRGDFLIEKLTELGVTRVVPLETERSIAHPRIERLQRAVIEASKQCGRNVLMEVSAVAKWNDYCRSGGVDETRLLAHVGDEKLPTLVDANLNEISGPKQLTVAIGPEGGWTDDEVALARSAGWQVVGLGPRVLRIETAAIALASYFALSSAIRA